MNSENPQPTESQVYKKVEPEKKEEGLAGQWKSILRDSERLRTKLHKYSDKDRPPFWRRMHLNTRKEDRFIADILSGVSDLTARYGDFLDTAIHNSDLMGDVQNIYINTIVRPVVDKSISNGELTREAGDDYLNTIDVFYRSRKDFNDETIRMWNAISNKEIKIKAVRESNLTHYNMYADYQLMADFMQEFASSDLATIYKALESRVSPDRRHDVVSLFLDSMKTKKSQDNDSADNPFTQLFRRDVFNKAIHRDYTSEFSKTQIKWWQAMMASPEAKSVFGGAIEGYDRKVYEAVLESSFDGFIQSNKLFEYLTPDAIRNIVILIAQCCHYGGLLLDKLSKRGDLKELFDKAQQKYPALQTLLPLIEKPEITSEEGMKQIEKESSSIISSLLKDEYAKKDKTNKKLVYQMCSAIPFVDVLNNILESNLPNDKDGYDMYRILFNGIGRDPDSVLNALKVTHDKYGRIPGNVSDLLLNYLFQWNDPQKEETPTSKQYADFFNQMRVFLAEVNRPESPWSQRELDGKLLTFIKNGDDNSKKLITIANQVPQLIDLIMKGGVLNEDIEHILEDVFSNEDNVKRAREIVEIFSKKIPYWKQLFFYTEKRFGKALEESDSNWIVYDVPETHPINEESNKLPDDFSFDPHKITEMTVYQKRQIANLDNLSDSEVEGLVNIPFSQLKGKYKKIVFGYRLYDVYRKSSEKQYRQFATERNKKAEDRIIFSEDMYVHGSNIDNFGSILSNGNLAGEALGEKSTSDDFPFHVDLSIIPKYAKESGIDSVEDILSQSQAWNFGKKGSKRDDGQILFIYDKKNTNWPREDNLISYRHIGVLAGIPSTEISHIILRSEDTTFNEVKQHLIETRLYIPVYNLNGDLVFKYDEYEELVKSIDPVVPGEVDKPALEFVNALRAEELFDDEAIARLVPLWRKLVSEDGYQHDKVLLGNHLKTAVSTLKKLPEYESLSESDKSLALIAVFFHDIKKPTGKQTEYVHKDNSHEIPSAKTASEFLERWGYPKTDIDIVTRVILNDGIVSDIIRRAVISPDKNLNPQQLLEAVGSKQALKILRAVNKADVIATVGEDGFNNIAEAYDEFFENAYED